MRRKDEQVMSEHGLDPAILDEIVRRHRRGGTARKDHPVRLQAARAEMGPHSDLDLLVIQDCPNRLDAMAADLP